MQRATTWQSISNAQTSRKHPPVRPSTFNVDEAFYSLIREIRKSDKGRLPRMDFERG
jgi:hypothetical protein